MIPYHAGVPAHAQRLIYGGKQMQDNYTLGFYGIEKESVVQVVLRLLGGA